ncbi:MAG TPA: ABC transporter substrate-binding protein [Rhodocyclaceae bacterium]|nr:ABC transporter substrate-binding protein [Rhodocyclaceae bacterium]
MGNRIDLRKFLSLAICVVLAMQVFAQEAPDAMVKDVTNEVLGILKKGTDKSALKLVEQKVIPHFDFERMTALAVGRDWRSATPEQRKALIDAFHDLLVNTYSNALASYKGETVDFKPSRSAPSSNEATVHSEIHQSSGKAIPLDYVVEKHGNEWKVYDVSVAGISLVTNYRQQFSTEVQRSGIDGLIKLLQEKNRGNAASRKANS